MEYSFYFAGNSEKLLSVDKKKIIKKAEERERERPRGGAYPNQSRGR